MGAVNSYSSIENRKKSIILAVFVCAFAIRLFYVLETRSSVLTHEHFFLDPRTNDLLAIRIATEDFWGDEPFFRAPLYPYFLGILYSIFGHIYLIPRLLQALMGSMSCVLLYLIGRRLFGNWVALMGALLACFYWILIYYDGELLIPVLSVFLNLLAIFLLLKGLPPSHSNKSAEKWMIGAGLILGLSAIARPNILIFLPCIILWLCTVGRHWGLKRTFLLSLLLVLGTAIVILPVTLRNYIVGGDFVLISSQGGVNFFIGNNSKSDGKTPIQPAVVPLYEDYQFRREHKGNIWARDNVWRASKIIAEKALGRKLRPSEISRFWYEQATKFITRKPWSFIKLFLKKIYFLWNAYEIPSNDNIYNFIRSNSRILNWLSYFHFGIVGPLSLLGIGLSLIDWRRYLLIYLYLIGYGFSIVFFFVTGRYRVPLLPLLLLFAAYAVISIVHKIREKDYRHLIIYMLVLTLLFSFVNSNLFGVREVIIDMHQELGW